MGGPEIVAAAPLLAAGETAGAGLGAFGAASVPAAAGAGAAAPGLTAGLYDLLLPQVGAQQAAMLAEQTGTFGMPGLAATGNAAASVGSPAEQALWGQLSQWTGPQGAKLGKAADTLKAASRGMQAAQLLNPQQQQMARPVPATLPAPMPQMPQTGSTGRAPTPIEIAMAKRYLARGGMA